MILGKLLAIALGVVFLGLSTCPRMNARTEKGERRTTATGSTLSLRQRNLVLERHNQLRSQEGSSNMRKLTWNNTLALEAQTSANSCNLGREMPLPFTGSGSYTAGQNQYFTTDPARQEDRVLMDGMWSWYMEKGNYDYEGGGCVLHQRCDHYTQLVWAESKEVGCGLNFCYSLSDPKKNHAYVHLNAYYFVCRYVPVLHMPGARPFKLGKKCFQCPLDQPRCTNNGLCTAHYESNLHMDTIKRSGGMKRENGMRTDKRTNTRTEFTGSKNAKNDAATKKADNIIGTKPNAEQNLRTTTHPKTDSRAVMKRFPEPRTGRHCEAKDEDLWIGVILVFDKKDTHNTWQKSWDSFWPVSRFQVAEQLNYFCNKYVEQCCPGAKPNFSPYAKKYRLFVEVDNICQNYKRVLLSGELEVSLHAKVVANNDLCQQATNHKKTYSDTANAKEPWLLLSTAMAYNFSFISKSLEACCNITLKAILPDKSINGAAGRSSNKTTQRMCGISITGGQLCGWVYGVIGSVATAVVLGLIVLLTYRCKKVQMKGKVYREDKRSSIPQWQLAQKGLGSQGSRRRSSSCPECGKDIQKWFPLPPTYDPYKFLDPPPNP